MIEKFLILLGSVGMESENPACVGERGAAAL